MKAEATYNGLSLEWYTMGDRDQFVTFEVTGVDIYENYYDVTVEAYKGKDGQVYVEPTDAEGYDYDNMVERVIMNLAPYMTINF